MADKKGTGYEALEYFFDWVKMNNITYKIQIMFHTMSFYGLRNMITFYNENIERANIQLFQTTPIKYTGR